MKTTLFSWAVLVCLSTGIPMPIYNQKELRFDGTILFQSNFETADDLSRWTKEVCRPDAITLSDKVARKGRYSARFEFKKEDALLYKGFVRAELKQNFSIDTTGENWYGFSNFFPDDYISDPFPEVVAQWHEVPDWDLGETWRSPPISLEIRNDHYYVKVMWASAPVNTNRTKDGEIYYDLGAVDKNIWNDWVFHIKFSYTSTGILEVWKNKTNVVTRNGPNSYNDQHWPYFKLGIYKWAWSKGGAGSPEDERVLYVDEVRVGDRNSSLEAVSPK